MKDRGTLSSIASVETLIEVYMSANEPKTFRDEYSWATKILDPKYRSAILDDVIKTREDLHVEEHHQLKILIQNMNIYHLFDGMLGEFNMESISIQLMDPNFKLIHARTYMVPRSLEQQLQ
jgi:hypothetical protein